MSGECVGSGFCCKRAPCPFGTWNEELHQCNYLVVSHFEADTPVYRCGKYAEIIKQPFADFAPAFGAGCCSSLFNEERNKLIRARRSRRTLRLTVLK